MKRRQQLGGRASAILLFLIGACTVVGHQKVSGWPQLQIVEHHVPHAQMRDRCAKYTGFGMSPQACVEFYLKARQCHIWYSADFPPTRQIVEHERLHCRGYDHIGATTMQALLARYRTAQESASGGATQAVRAAPAVQPSPPSTVGR
jgi:hypothetical protein